MQEELQQSSSHSLLTSTGRSWTHSHGKKVKSSWSCGKKKKKAKGINHAIFTYFSIFPTTDLSWREVLDKRPQHNNGSIHPAATSQGGFIKKSVITDCLATEWIVARNDRQLKWPANIWIANDFSNPPSLFFFFKKGRLLVMPFPIKKASSKIDRKVQQNLLNKHRSWHL